MQYKLYSRARCLQISSTARRKSTRSPAPPLLREITNCEAPIALRRVTPPGASQSTRFLATLPPPQPTPHRPTLLLSLSPPRLSRRLAARAANPPTLASHWLLRSRASGIAPLAPVPAPKAEPCLSPPAFSKSQRKEGDRLLLVRAGVHAPPEGHSLRLVPIAAAAGSTSRARALAHPLPLPGRGSPRAVSSRSHCSSGIFLGRTRTASSAAVPSPRPRWWQ